MKALKQVRYKKLEQVKGSKTKMLVEHVGSGTEFLDYLDEIMTAWIPHDYVRRHQDQHEKLLVKAVRDGPPCSRLVTLVDWSATLSLEPDSSATAGSYPEVGLIISVNIFKEMNGRVRVETVSGVLEDNKSDVRRTHAFMRKFGVRKIFILHITTIY
jgi:hypothetical protein